MKENLETKFNDFEGRYDFSATEWTGLEARLKKRDLWRRGALALLAGLFLLGSVGSNVALWRQNYALSQKLSTFETSKINVGNTVSSTVLAQTDTIFKRTIIYKFDTIYRKTRVVEQPFSPLSVSRNSVREQILSTDDDKLSNILREEKMGTPQYKSENLDKNSEISRTNEEKQAISTTLDSLNQKESNAKKPILGVADTIASNVITATKMPDTKDSILKKVSSFDSLGIAQKEDKMETKMDDKTADKTEKKHPKYAFKMLPIYVGAVLGLPIATQSSIIGQTGNQYGLKAEIVATERVRFFVEMLYTKNVETKSLDLAMLPADISPPKVEPGLTFKYWETYGVKSFNYIAGVQYQFGKNETFHPYIAAAFNATSTLPFDIDFEYTNKLTGLEKSYTKNVTELEHLNRIYGAIGVHWNAFKNGQLGAETYFTTPLDDDKALTPTQLGFKFGLFYFIR
jgi:hypothetical protein